MEYEEIEKKSLIQKRGAYSQKLLKNRKISKQTILSDFNNR